MSLQPDLNWWPLPYQGSALPLSYIGLPTDADNLSSGKRDSNPRPSAWKADALASWATPAFLGLKDKVNRQGLQPNFEPITLNRLANTHPSRNFDTHGGESRIRTCEGVYQQIYSLSSLAAWVSPPLSKTYRYEICKSFARACGGIRTPDQLITNQLLWPTELHRLVSL